MQMYIFDKLQNTVITNGGETLNISQLEKFESLPKISLENEIRFASTSSEDVFILKIRERDSDFNGNPIQKPENNIRTQSILWFNLNNGTVSEVVPFGDFDINSFYVTRKYIYYERITDVDHDGFLSEADYRNGKIWIMDRSTFVQELWMNLLSSPQKIDYRLLRS